jgi:hypothetical protein
VQLLGQPISAAQKTSAEGIALFRVLSSKSGSYRVEVLAPGFAAETADISSSEDVTTIKLHVATAAETVVVTATRTLAEGNSAGADVDILSSGQLEAMQPAAAADAVRFLSGAVVNDGRTAWRALTRYLFVAATRPTTRSLSMES